LPCGYATTMPHIMLATVFAEHFGIRPVTPVCRAATPEAREHMPYKIVLVDTAEGFRMMAHGDNDLDIGDEVTARYRRFCRSPGSVF
jgi:hypothetical protein